MALRTSTKYIVIHCADTYDHMDIGVAEIDRWHKGRGWNGVGYHDVIRRNGALEFGRDENAIGAHAYGHNRESVGICLVGGKALAGGPENNFTPEQFKTLKRVLRFYKILFPEALVVGHRDLNPNKDCPSFDVGQWVADEL